MRITARKALCVVMTAAASLLADSSFVRAGMSEQELIHTRAAIQHYDTGQIERARALAAQVPDPLAQKLLRWIDLTRDNSGAGFDEYTSFLEANPDWPGQEALRANAERAMPPALSDAEALKWFARWTPVTGEGRFRQAIASLRLGDSVRAVELARQVWVSGELGEDDERIFRQVFGAHIEAAHNWQRLDRLLWDRKAAAARRLARRMSGGYPALAEARLALAFLEPGVDTAISRVPAEFKQDFGLIYERALWRQRKGRLAGVAELLEGLDKQATNPQAWWPLREWAARRSFEARDYGRAYRLAADHRLPDGLGFAEGEWLAGWIALRYLKKPEAALGHFTRLYDGVGSPISRSRGAYWAGEALRALGQKQEAAVWYGKAAANPETFYGQLAAARIDRPAFVDLSPPVDPTSAEKSAFRKQEVARSAILLGELGDRDRQTLFFARLRYLAHSAKDYLLLIDFAHTVGRPDMALQAAKAARADGVILSQALFPLPAFDYGNAPEPALVAALIRQESLFDTHAVSRSNARGLMQLLPGTAKGVARKIGLSYSLERLTKEPDFNLALGRSYLREVLARYDNSYLLALAAYNAGPSRVDRWIAQLGDPRREGIDAVDWAESIPFGETRNYVQRILEALLVYRQRLSPDQTAEAGRPAAQRLDEARRSTLD